MTSYITGLGGTPGAGWFTDGNGQPKLWVATETWALPNRAGEWTSPAAGTGAGLRQFLRRPGPRRASPSSMTDPVAGTSSGAPNDNGKHLGRGNPPRRGKHRPVVGGAEQHVLGPHRLRVLLCRLQRDHHRLCRRERGRASTAATCADFLDGYASGLTGGRLSARGTRTPRTWSGLSGTTCSPRTRTPWDSSPLRPGSAARGTRTCVTPWYNAECTSRYATDTNASEDWGVSNASFNFCYTYNAGYLIIEYAYGEVANEGAANLLPVMWGDGYFYQGSGGGYSRH